MLFKTLRQDVAAPRVIQAGTLHGVCIEILCSGHNGGPQLFRRILGVNLRLGVIHDQGGVQMSHLSAKVKHAVFTMLPQNGRYQ